MNKIDYEFEIDQLGVHKELHGRKNVVYEIRAFLVAHVTNTTTENTSQFSEKVFFVVNLPTDELHMFKEYDKLTKEDIIRWINQHTAPEILDVYMKKLDEQINPSKVYLKPNF